MERVTGIGGVFFRADDPKALVAHLVNETDIEPDDLDAIRRLLEEGSQR